jgi:tetratricopeptide (TPR) repeat protein
MSRLQGPARAERPGARTRCAPWLCTAIAVVWLPGMAAAAPRKVTGKQAATSTSVDDSAAALLRRGRALAARGRFAEAVAALDAALGKTPDDPLVLNELGVALRELGDLARAEAVCRDAAKATEPRVRAAALYNLGRVLEQRRDTAAAIAAYRDSLQLRHTRSARERLIALDPIATSEVTRTHPLQGPMPSLELWCSQQGELCAPGYDAFVVSLRDPDPSHEPDPEWPPGQHAPWDELRVIVSQVHATECLVGLRTKRGWFVDRIPDCAAAHYSGRDVRVQLDDSIASAEGHELQLRLRSFDPYRTWDPASQHSAYATDDYAAVVICGLGPSGAPHCTPSIGLIPMDGETPGSGGLAPSWAHGLLVLDPVADPGHDAGDEPSSCRDGCALAPRLRELAGRHRILFP